MNYGAEGSDEFNKGYEHCQEVMKQRGEIPLEDLRDWFAGQALTTLLSSSWNLNLYESTARAYEIADMMMEARSGKPRQ